MFRNMSCHHDMTEGQDSDSNIYFSKEMEERFIPSLTEQNFWAAVYEFDPLASETPEITRLERIMESGQLSELILGKIHGKTTLKLIPCEGALPTTDTPGFKPTLDYAVTDCGAVSYPDGHPSEELAPYATRSAAYTSQGSSITLPTIGDDEDETLRRFASLGYVIQESESIKEAWEKSGHVLVIDMVPKTIRNRHPWFILAHEWPTDNNG